MKKSIITALFFITVHFYGIGYSLDTTSTKYFPLQTGNVWVYSRTDNAVKYRASILRDTVVNLHKYYYCYNFPYPGTGWFRVDSTTGSLMRFELNNPCPLYYFQERIIDSLGAIVIGITTGNTCYSGIGLWDTSNVTVFGQSRKSKQFGMPGYHQAFWEKYVRDIGISIFNYCFYQPYGCYTYNLTGAVIGGVLYGDTTGATALVGIDPYNNEIPGFFSLSQNYPNPFNPSTKIRFSIPLSRGVSEGSVRRTPLEGVLLIVYDLLGREVATLVNEELKPGTYEADWDASNFSSGVYFYKLVTSEFSETKKMVLMK